MDKFLEILFSIFVAFIYLISYCWYWQFQLQTISLIMGIATIIIIQLSSKFYKRFLSIESE